VFVLGRTLSCGFIRKYQTRLKRLATEKHSILCLVS
jgi:hypothetical protein